MPGTAGVWQGGWRPALGSSAGMDPSWCRIDAPCSTLPIPHMLPRQTPLTLAHRPLHLTNGHMHSHLLVFGGPDITTCCLGGVTPQRHLLEVELPGQLHPAPSFCPFIGATSKETHLGSEFSSPSLALPLPPRSTPSANCVPHIQFWLRRSCRGPSSPATLETCAGLY